MTVSKNPNRGKSYKAPVSVFLIFLVFMYFPQTITISAGLDSSYLSNESGSIESVQSDLCYRLNSSSNYRAAWSGSAANERLTQDNSQVTGVQWTNVDNGAHANDLLVAAVQADANGKLDSGAVYLIKNADQKTNLNDLSNPANFDAAWTGSTAFDQVGKSDRSGPSIQLINIDNGSYANDLLINAHTANVNGKTDNGAIYLIKNVDSLSGAFNLGNSASYSAVWAGAASGDQLGYTNLSGPGTQLVNADNGAYSNDLIVTAALANANGLTDNGAIYLITNIDQKSGLQDLQNPVSYQAAWTGAANGDKLGSTLSRRPSVQLVNVDNGSYANDLLVPDYLADAGGRLDNGAVYLLRDIDSQTGVKALSNPANFFAGWMGAANGDQLGFSQASGSFVRLSDTDGQGYANDLLIGTSLADSNGKTDNGAVYFIQNADAQSGWHDLAQANSYTSAWVGASNLDRINHTLTREDGLRWVDLDNGGIGNDLVIPAILADGLGRTDNGALYVIQNATSASGMMDLANAASYTTVIFGGAAGDQLGYTNISGPSLQIMNTDGEAYSNDFLLTTSNANADSLIDNGAVYLIRNADSRSGVIDLSNSANYSAAWAGAANSDGLGQTNHSGYGVQAIDLNGDGLRNDLLIAASYADNGAMTDSGAVYLILDIQNRIGLNNLGLSANFDAAWIGASAGDRLTFSDDNSFGMQVVNIDDNQTANDLLLTASKADIDGGIDNGAAYLIRNIQNKTGVYSLGNTLSMTACWSGGANNDNLGYSLDSGMGVLLFNGDGQTYTNDLLLSAPSADVNGKSDAGALYWLKNVYSKPTPGMDPELLTWINQPVDVSLTCDAGAFVSCSSIRYQMVSGSNPSGGSSEEWVYYDQPFSIEQDGVWSLQLQGQDSEGIWGDIVTHAALVDQIIPAVSIRSPANNSVKISSSVNVQFEGSDHLSGIKRYWVSTDNVNWTDNGLMTSFFLNNQTLGLHTYYVKAEDNAGNVSAAASVSVTFQAAEWEKGYLIGNLN